MSPPPFDAVLFDLDGTLVATDRYWVPAAHRACRRAFAELGIERAIPDAGQWLALVGGPLEVGIARVLPDLDSAARARLLVLCQEEEDALISQGNAALLPGVEETLDELAAAGVHLGIASNCGAGYLAQVSGALDLDRWFDEMRCLDSPGVENKADMVEDLLHTFDTRSAVMVGDRLSDGEAARANGLPFVHVDTGYAAPGEERGADLTLIQLSELSPALRRRTQVLESARDELALPRARATAIGVTGRRACGKTLFARDLARLYAREGRGVMVVSMSDFRVHESTGEALAGYAVDALLEQVLGPHARGESLRIDAPAGGREIRLDGGELLVLEGPFLLDPRLSTRLDRVIYLEVSEDLALARLAGRDGRLAGPGPLAAARSVDLPAEARFEARFPAARADLVVDGRPLAPRSTQA